MSRRRRRRARPLLLGLVLLLGAAVGAAVLSVLWRAQDTPRALLSVPEVQVEVLNGCGADGAADRVASKLRRGGYQVDRIGRADHYHYRQDVVVIRRPAGAEDAHRLSRLLEDAPIIQQNVPNHAYDITIIVGRPHPLVPAG